MPKFAHKGLYLETSVATKGAGNAEVLDARKHPEVLTCAALAELWKTVDCAERTQMSAV